jgi:endonuclease-3 related protein
MREYLWIRRRLKAVYRRLFKHYGPRNWWPAETHVEVMVGAVLTQNTAWRNVERAMANLREADCLDAAAIAGLDDAALAGLIRPSGYFNVKARRLKSLCRWYVGAGGFSQINQIDTNNLRHELLAVHGVGRETADDILLYGFKRPVFVIDAYTKRLFARLELVKEGIDYESLRGWFEAHLPAEVQHYNEFHALIDHHGNQICRPRPLCDGCCLRSLCPSASA